MPARWSFFAFDWTRFRSTAPPLLRASKSGDFTTLQIPEADEVLCALDEETPPESVANALVAHLCGAQDAALFEGGLSELVLWLRKQPHGEEAGETLGELISAGKNVEEWFQSDTGLIGILTEEETQSLASAFAYFRKTYRPPDQPRGLAAITRRFSAADPAKEHLSDLMEVIDEAAARGAGLAVLRED
jgi:hypothetical protein